MSKFKRRLQLCEKTKADKGGNADEADSWLKSLLPVKDDKWPYGCSALFLQVGIPSIAKVQFEDEIKEENAFNRNTNKCC